MVERRQIREQLEALGRERRLIQEPGVVLRWQSALQPLADADLQAVAKALGIWSQGRSSVLRLLNPAFHSARSLLQQRVPEVLGNDINLSISLQNALSYEIQLRRDCRRHELLRRDLGLPQNPANLRQQELLTAVDLLLEQFDRASGVVQATRQCPLQRDADEALRSGRPERISSFLDSLQAGVRRQALRQQCRQSLLALSPWCEQHWIKALEQRIATDQPIAAAVDSIDQSWHTLVDFQLYRRRAASLGASEQAVIAVLRICGQKPSG